MTRSRIITAVIVIALVAAFFVLDLDRFLTLEYFNARQAAVRGFVGENPGLAAGGFFTVYVGVTALSIPGAALMTLIGGALFGLLTGTVIVSFASTIGATLAFVLSRFLLRDWVENRFSSTVTAVNRGIDKEGSYYLFTLRLVPLFPFFAINLVMGLTRLPARTFYWVSQVGMLPATLVYVNAGTRLGQIESSSDILSPGLLGSFALLGIFPLLAKRSMAFIEARRHMKNFSKPETFDTNLVVIGAGSAGLVTAYVAAGANARVTLIEKNRMGGDCLNTGCVPSKAIIRSARIAAYARRSDEFGVSTGEVEIDFPRVMERVRSVIRRIEPHDSIERYSALGVDCISGEARITSPWCVEVDDRRITTRSIVIATGGRPVIPPIPGLEQVPSVTSDTIWNLDDCPARLLVMGGGPIGCELAQAFARLGSKVTLVEMQPQLLGGEDDRVSDAILDALRRDSVEVLANHRITGFERNGERSLAHCESDNHRQAIEFDVVLLAVGRRASTESLGLDALGVGQNENGTIATNEFLQTRWPNILACGDVAGPWQLTHAAGHQGWYCAMNALFGHLKRFRVDDSVMPRAIFTDPEVARVGLNEREASEQGIAFEVTHYSIEDLDRAIADGAARGFVRALTAPGQDRILGVTIVGSHAGDLIAEYALAMRHGLGLRKILGTIHAYPTLAEASRHTAGEWQKAHLPQGLLALARRFHDWRRG